MLIRIARNANNRFENWTINKISYYTIKNLLRWAAIQFV